MQKSIKSLFIIFTVSLLINVSNVKAQMFWNQAASIADTNISYVSYPNSSSLNITGSFTLEAWIKPSNLSSTLLGIICKSKSLYSYSLTMDPLGRIKIGTNGITRLISRTSNGLSLNNWSHVAGSYNASTNIFKIYINGVLDTSITIAGVQPVSNTDSLFIGNAGVATFAYSAQIDEIRAWNIERSNAEISQYRFTSLGATGGIYTGLVLSTTFQDANSTGTDFGTSDMSGNNNAGFSRNVTPVDLSDNPSGIVGQNDCLQFDGIEDYVAGKDTVAVSPTGSITLECWVQPLILTSCRFISKGSSASPNYALTMTSVVSAVINGTTITGAGTPSLKQWTHIAFTYSGSSGKFTFYRNGILVDSGTAALGNITNGTDSIYIGGGPGSITDFNGYMDEVRISNYVKTQNEIVNFMHESIDEGNDPATGGNTNVVYNLDGLALDNANAGGPRLFFKNDAKFSSSSSVANQPVSPLNRADALHFSEGFYMKSVNKRIPASGTTGITTDSLSVNLNLSITDINFYIALNHMNSANLEITLFAPNGDSVKVFDNNTSSGNSDNIVTVFDDNADSSLISGRYATFSNNIKPANNMLAVFRSDNCQGKWSIRINDQAGTDTGRVYAWGVQINNQPLREKNLNLTGLIQGFFNSSTGFMVPDTIKVTLRNSVFPYTKIDSAKTILNNTGDASLSFKSPSLQNNVDYFIQVNHRNSIETWSATTQKFNFFEINYNFRSLLSNAFGNNMIFLAGSPSRFGFFNGDVDQDGTIDAADVSETDNDASNSLSGYVRTDVTGDNFVDASDVSLVNNNAFDGVSSVTP